MQVSVGAWPSVRAHAKARSCWCPVRSRCKPPQTRRSFTARNACLYGLLSPEIWKQTLSSSLHIDEILAGEAFKEPFRST